MKALIAAAVILAAAPAAAFEVMTQEQCKASYRTAADYLAPQDPLTQTMVRSVTATAEGWCQISEGNPGFEGAGFETFAWRMDDTDRWIKDGIPPLGLQLRVTGLDPNDERANSNIERPPLTLEATWRQNPSAGQVILERAVVFNDAGDTMALSGVFERVFLSSPAMMQVSAGSATMKAGLMALTLEGTHENPFGFGPSVTLYGEPDARRAAAFDWVSALPDGVVDAASRAELMAYAGDLPRPIGTLEVSVASERGLGLMQLGASLAMTLSELGSEAAVSDRDQLSVLLDGLTARVNWTPTAQVAD